MKILKIIVEVKAVIEAIPVIAETERVGKIRKANTGRSKEGTWKNILKKLSTNVNQVVNVRGKG